LNVELAGEKTNCVGSSGAGEASVLLGLTTWDSTFWGLTGNEFNGEFIEGDLLSLEKFGRFCSLYTYFPR
jgi:hypothetical protein